MWYDSLMPEILPERDIDDAEAAIQFAQAVRRAHRLRRDGNHKRRASDIKIALDRLREAMRPLRSHIGRFPYGPTTPAAEANRQLIRMTSLNIQKERRKLHKMKKATHPYAKPR
jgi:hypothetical protein